jgi:hypothetical protein
MRHGATHYKYTGVKQNISFTSSASAATTNDIGAQIRTVRLTTDQDVYVTFVTGLGASSTTGLTLRANNTEYFAIDEGVKINARGATASGTLEIAEMSL